MEVQEIEMSTAIEQQVKNKEDISETLTWKVLSTA